MLSVSSGAKSSWIMNQNELCSLYPGRCSSSLRVKRRGTSLKTGFALILKNNLEFTSMEQRILLGKNTPQLYRIYQLKEMWRKESKQLDDTYLKHRTIHHILEELISSKLGLLLSSFKIIIWQLYKGWNKIDLK